MRNFASWWVCFGHRLPILLRLLSNMAQYLHRAALRVPNWRSGDYYA